MFFGLSSLVLGLLLFGIVLGTTLLGVAVGRRLRAHGEALREPFGVLQAALLGLVGLILAFAPFLRYLLGMLYLDTAGSLLAVGVMHGAFNAAGALGFVRGGWQYIPAMMVLTIAMTLWRVIHRR